MTTIQIPLDGDEQDREIVADYGVHIVKGWTLAARIYARCEPQQVRRPASERLSANLADKKVSFAHLSRTTGRSETNIRKHWHNWQDAVDDGRAVAVKPGDTVTLPEDEYPGTANGPGLRGKFTAATPPDVKAEAILEVMEREPDVARRVENAFVQRAGKDAGLAGRVFRTYAEHNVTPAKPVEPPLPLIIGAGVGASIYADIKRSSKDIGEYVRAIEAHPDDPERVSIVQEDLDNLEKGERLLREYADVLRRALGVDSDAVFNRLVGGRS